jgi:hypothetical protein
MMTIFYIISIVLPNIFDFLYGHKILSEAFLQHFITLVFLIHEHVPNRFRIPIILARYCFNHLKPKVRLYFPNGSRPYKYKSNILLIISACSGNIIISSSTQVYPMKFLYLVKISHFSNLR